MRQTLHRGPVEHRPVRPIQRIGVRSCVAQSLQTMAGHDKALGVAPHAAAVCRGDAGKVAVKRIDIERHDRIGEARQHHEVGGLPGFEPRIVGLRYFNVFGPGEASKGGMASMAYQLAKRMLAGDRPRLFTGGEQARDQVSVHDVVGCTLAAAGLGATDRPRPGVYNLGSGRATTFNEVAEAVRDGLGLDAEAFAIEYFEMPAKVRAFYQDFTLADMTAAAEGLGWTPKHDPTEAIRTYASELANDSNANTPAAGGGHS